jgi:hypothetical protein
VRGIVKWDECLFLDSEPHFFIVIENGAPDRT